MKNKNKSGVAIILYLLIMAIFIALLMATAFSRLLLALKRGQSTSDSLIANYSAESEIYDTLARLSGDYLKPPFTTTKNVNGTSLTINATENNGVEEISVTADRAFASTKLVAERKVETVGGATDADVLLGLDCTSSMNDKTTTGNGKTRIANLKAAALNFVNSVPPGGKFHLGVFVFGIDAKWLTTATGVEVNLKNNLSTSDIANAISNGFDDSSSVDPSGESLNWRLSKACQTIMDSTSIGTGFTFAQDYFKGNQKKDTKQVEIIITDGEPNSRIPYADCAPSIYCPFQGFYCVPPYTDKYGSCAASGSKVCTPAGVQFLGCSVADKNTTFVYTYVDDSGKSTLLTNKGLRDPNIDAYAVTISTAVNGEAATILRTYLGANYFPADKASQLTGVLSKILTDIVTKHETITIHKSIPGT